jgi:hypothetical protein
MRLDCSYLFVMTVYTMPSDQRQDARGSHDQVHELGIFNS